MVAPLSVHFMRAYVGTRNVWDNVEYKVCKMSAYANTFWRQDIALAIFIFITNK